MTKNTKLKEFGTTNLYQRVKKLFIKALLSGFVKKLPSGRKHLGAYFSYVIPSKANQKLFQGLPLKANQKLF